MANIVWKRPNWRSKSEAFLILLHALVIRDIRARYRRSFLGPLWAILQPLILMILFSMLRSIVDIPSDGTPYLIFTYSALVPWTFFSNSVVRCGPSVSSNNALVKKMALSREVFPTAAIVTGLFDMAMSAIVLLVMMLYYDTPINASLLWLLPLVLITTALAWGTGIAVASLATYRNDFLFATPFLMQVWLFATPVMYPLSSVPEKWLTLYKLNPGTGLIEAYRAVLVAGQSPDLMLLAQSTAGTVLICAVALPLFRIMSQYFADVL
ncbi:MAG TPA: ABC transporter permease [Aggregatilineales bacterium]|nr:ABC transporter permease [Aggregatilineales bacterium]